MSKITINRSAIKELKNRGYHNRHIAIVMGCCEDMVYKALKNWTDCVEPTLKFLTTVQKQRLFVLDKMLELKRPTPKWSSDDYYYITILKFLLVPRETIYNLYKNAPRRPVVFAHRETSPILRPFHYNCFGINDEEYLAFVKSCYNLISDSTKWR